MTGFERFDENGVYDLRLSDGRNQTMVVTKVGDDQIEGYVAEPYKGTMADPDASHLRVDGSKRLSFRLSAIIGKAFEGGFRSFDSFEFPYREPTSLILEVPEDARDTVENFDYRPVECDIGDCGWEGDAVELEPGDRCPVCGYEVPTE